MMAVGELKKQPFEELNCAIDFSSSLVADDTITLDAFLATNSKTGAVSTSVVVAPVPAPSVDHQKVIFRVFGGADGDRHKLTARVSVSTGEKLEADLDLLVKEQ